MSINSTNQNPETAIEDAKGEQNSFKATESQQPLTRFQSFQRNFRSLDVIAATDKDKLQWELEKHLSLYKDYCDLAVKGGGIFAATVGEILSISFALNCTFQEIFPCHYLISFTLTLGLPQISRLIISKEVLTLG